MERANTSELESPLHACPLVGFAQEEVALSALLCASHEDASRVDLVLVQRLHRLHGRLVLLEVNEPEPYSKEDTHT